MSQPPAYVPVHAFVADSATLANFPGQALDVEFQDIKTTTDAIRSNLALVQRDDGALANGVVTYESLSGAVQVNGLAPASAWVTGTAYQVGNSVVVNNTLYRCLVVHTSTVFATDLAAAKWVLVTSLVYGAGTNISLAGSVISVIANPTFTTVNGNTFTSGPYTLTGAAGKTFTFSNTLTLAGTDGTTLTFQGTDTYVGRATTDTLTNKTFDTAAAGNSLSINGVAATANTGTGAVARADGPTFTVPILGVATATTYNKVTITAPASAATLTLIDGTTLTGPAASGTAMTLGNTETVTGVKTFGSAGAVGRLKVAGTTSGSTVLDATAVASGTLTLPAATDTLMGKSTTDIFSNKTFDTGGTGNTLQVGSITVSRGQFPGTVTNDSANAANVGELVTASVVVGSAVALTTNVAANITSISLTAGDWDVSACASFLPAGTTNVTQYVGTISTTSATLNTTPGNITALTQAAAVPGNLQSHFCISPVRISLSGTTTVFLVSQTTHTGSTMGGFGMIRARRVR